MIGREYEGDEIQAAPVKKKVRAAARAACMRLILRPAADIR